MGSLRRCLNLLLFAFAFPFLMLAHAAEPVPVEPPQPPEPEAPLVPAPPGSGTKSLVELGDLKVPAATVWQIEQGWLAALKKRDPTFQVPAKERASRRRDIALRELTLALVQKMAADRKLTAAPAGVEKEIADLRQQLKADGGNYDEYLSLMCKTDAEFRKITTASLALRTALVADVTDAEVEKLFAQYSDGMPLRRASHVLYAYQGAQVSQNPRSKEEARKLAEDAAAKAHADPKFDFADLARKTSDCPSAKQGGDLNFSPHHGEGQMVAAFADALYKIPKVGDYSGVVETDFGFHVIKLTELKTLPDYAPQIHLHLAQQKVAALLQQALGEKNEKVTFNEGLLAMAPPDEKPVEANPGVKAPAPKEPEAKVPPPKEPEAKAPEVKN